MPLHPELHPPHANPLTSLTAIVSSLVSHLECSCSELSWLHDRMPVILDDRGVDEWLSPTPFSELLLRPVGTARPSVGRTEGGNRADAPPPADVGGGAGGAASVTPAAACSSPVVDAAGASTPPPSPARPLVASPGPSPSARSSAVRPKGPLSPSAAAACGGGAAFSWHPVDAKMTALTYNEPDASAPLPRVTEHTVARFFMPRRGDSAGGSGKAARLSGATTRGTRGEVKTDGLPATAGLLGVWDGKTEAGCTRVKADVGTPEPVVDLTGDDDGGSGGDCGDVQGPVKRHRLG